MTQVTVTELKTHLGYYLEKVLTEDTQDTKALLLQLNIADEYFKSKERVDELEADLADYKQNQSDMKHELIALQIKMDTLKESILELENKNKELLLNKEQLESALENKLLN